MRKIFSFLTVVLILFNLSGCDKISDMSNNKIKIGIALSSNNTFLQSVCQSAEKAASQNDVYLDIYDANENSQKQIEKIQEWSDNGYAAVIVALCDDKSAKAVLSSAGVMPVVFINNMPSDTDILTSRQNVIYIGSKETDAGTMQGEFLSKYFLEKNNTAPTIAVISGNENNHASKLRIDSAKEALTKAGIMPFYVYENSGDWNKDKTQKDFSAFLKSKPKIDAVLAANDDMAIGAAEALSQAGYAISDIPITGVDATYEGRHALRDGRIDFTVYQNPENQGSGAINEIMLMLGGKSANVDTDSIQWQEYKPVTIENVDQLFPDDN